MTEILSLSTPAPSIEEMGPLSIGPRGPIEPIYAALKTDTRLAGETITRPHPLLAMLAREDYVVVIAPASVWDHARDLLKPFAPRLRGGDGAARAARHAEGPEPRAGAVARARHRSSARTRRTTSSSSRSRARSSSSTRRRAARRAASGSIGTAYESGELVTIARAMTTERDVGKLLGVILEKSRFVTGADAGSIYVVEGDEDRAHAALQADAERLGRRSTRASSSIPVSNRSIAGAAALEQKAINIADVYELPAESAVRVRPELRRADRLPDEVDARVAARLAARATSSASSS